MSSGQHGGRGATHHDDRQEGSKGFFFAPLLHLPELWRLLGSASAGAVAAVMPALTMHGFHSENCLDISISTSHPLHFSHRGAPERT